MKHSVIFYNNQVHLLLPDKPDRNQVIKQIDNINSLECWETSIPYYIASDKEFYLFRRFVNLIHRNYLETAVSIFYIEIPKNLYDWVKANSFKDLVAQISAYFAFSEMIHDSRNNQKSVLTNNLLPIIKNRIKNKKKEINSTIISSSDLLRYRNLYRRFEMNYWNRTKTILTFKYWKNSEITFNNLPIEPFLTDDSNCKNWSTDKELMNFHISEYLTKKRYKTIFINRFNVEPLGNNSNKNLDRWKEIYEHNLDQESNIYDEDVQIINDVKPLNFEERLECMNCTTTLEFEQQTDLKMSENHALLCNNCYLEKYFEREG